MEVTNPVVKTQEKIVDIFSEKLYKNCTADALLQWQISSNTKNKLNQEYSDIVQEQEKYTKDIQEHIEAKKLLELLKNYKLENRKDFILGVLNAALKDIFQSNYRLDIIAKDMKGQSAKSTQKYDIVFFQNEIEIAKNQELLTSNGGGVLSIASLFFKILIGYLYSGNKFYLFDESLSQVSPQYRIRLSLFLRKFCEEYNFTIVVVSQTEELDTDAHLVYEVSSSIDNNNVPVLDIANQMGEIPTEDFHYLGIKNFQSIKTKDFIFKGFCVIRGPNNSGKSAILRSIEAIIFNNFLPGYNRLNPGGNSLTTEITFGFIPKESIELEPKEIKLFYRNKKVQFEIAGEKYYGKQLAADKLKDAVEEIGFKYIDVKKLYKNFKGPLKDQTERIAYTNQYDGLFLIGSKNTESEKIFNFLFNTENIAEAVQVVKDITGGLLTHFNENDAKKNKLLVELENIEISNKRYLDIWYFSSIWDYIELVKNISKINDQIFKIKSRSDLIKEFISSREIISSFNESYSFSTKGIHEINKRIDLMNTLKISINDLEKLQWLVYYKTILSNSSELGELITKRKLQIQNSKIQIHLGTNNSLGLINRDLEKTDFKIKTLTSFTLVQEYLGRNHKIDILNNKITQSKNSLKSIQDKYNITECSECSGVGFIEYHQH